MISLNKLIIAVLILSAVPAVMILESNLTGHAVRQDTSPPVITITRLSALNSQAIIKWSTNEEASSIFKVGSKSEILGKNTNFEVTLENLNPGTGYKYSISACDKFNNCGQKEGSFTTTQKAQKAMPLTGSAVTDISLLSGKVNILIFLLVSIAASVIVIGGFVQKGADYLPAPMRVGIMLDNAETLLREKKHEEVYDIYGKMRTVYDGLNAREKGRYQRRALDVYSELLSHTRAVEANMLVDKYLSSSITKQELDRLRELLEI
ncbi:fibronectin type III domain-containing protein [Candidatus Woesearchaeota archaeon]|nr:fibronectin type III domain-containing protein [Candidatus Woesearchaeota archaeon]